MEHSGVKGMKWGVRKEHPSGSEIHAARGRQKALEVVARKGKTESERTAAAKKLLTSEDRVTSARLTTGEKVVAGLLAGPVGLAVIGLNARTVKTVAARTDAARKKA